MEKLVSMRLNESKGVTNYLWLFTGTCFQLQNLGLPAFDGKLKVIFLLLTLPGS
jgi:hypothetical protein